jgi:hypothetical protein
MMNKAERARLEAAETHLAQALALRWSGFETPARLPLPSSYRDFVNGWGVNPHGSGAVFEAWTSSVTHGFGHIANHDQADSASQNARPVFASKRDALIALRVAKERDFAARLAEIDAQIAEAAP